MESSREPIVLQVEGMTCVNCAQTVRKKAEDNGAQDVQVNFATGEMQFKLEDKSRLPDLIKSVNSLGYHASEANTDDEHGHPHGKNHSSRTRKAFIFCLVFTLPLFSHMFLPETSILQQPLLQLALCLPVYITGLLLFGRSAWSSLRMRLPNMDVLITLGSSAAFFYSLAGTILYYGTPHIHDFLFYETTATIITLIILGNLLEERSVNQTTTALRELNKIKTTRARRIEPDDKITEVDFEDIRVGDVLLVNSGDKIPVDGEITWGGGAVDESMVTGESLPVDKTIRDEVTGGTILHAGSLKMQAKRVGKDTLLSQMIELVRNAQMSKPPIQKMGDKVSAIFVPVVLGIALLTFLVSALVLDIGLQQSIMNSVSVLVISCPCAMGLATPTAVMAGIGRAAKNGILIKGGDTLELLARVRHMVLDKTGTLTTGDFRIEKIELENGTSREETHRIIAGLEQHSSHPIAQSLVKELRDTEAMVFEDVREYRGGGISGKGPDGHSYKLGSARYSGKTNSDTAASLFLTRNDALLASIYIGDTIKPGTAEVIKTLRKEGIEVTLLSGDRKKKTEETAAQCGITKVFSEQLPDEKLARIEAMSKQETTAMVGDGINDAPALARASVGISIGNATQTAIQSAQVILLGEKDLLQLPLAYKISKHTLLTIKQNLFWAFFYNTLAIPIAAAGYLNPMIAALAMAFSDVIVIGNSIRLKSKKI